jgi:hypothetical protein
MPSVKTKFEITKDGTPIRCPKNEAQLRRLPECAVFDNSLRPFQPVKPPKPPPHPPHPPDPKHSPFSPFVMKNLPDEFRRDIIPNTPASKDVRFPKPELLPDDPDDEKNYYSFRKLKQDDELAYSRGRTIMGDMVRDRIASRTTDPQAMRRQITSIVDKYGQNPLTYRTGLDDVDVLVDEPTLANTNVLVDDPDTAGQELRDLRQRDELVVDPDRFIEPTQAVVDRERDVMAGRQQRTNLTRMLAETSAVGEGTTDAVDPDRIPQERPAIPARRSRTRIARITPASEAGGSGTAPPELQDMALDSTNEFSVAPERDPNVRRRLRDLRTRRVGVRPVDLQEYDYLNQPAEEAPTINPFESEEAMERAILLLANKVIRRGKPRLDERDLERLFTKLRSRGVSRDDIRSTLAQYNMYDEGEQGMLQEMSTAQRETYYQDRARIDNANRARREARSAIPEPDEQGFTNISPSGFSDETRSEFRRRRGYGRLQTEDEDAPLTEMEEGQFMGRTNQNAITLDADENRYRVRVGGRNLSDSLRMNTIRARQQVQEAGRRFAEATNRVKSFANDLAVGTDRQLSQTRRDVSQSLRSGYSKVIQATSQLTPDEVADLQRQLSVLPPDADLSTRGVGIPQDMVLTDDPQVDIESGLVRPQLEEGLDFEPFRDVDIDVPAGTERPSLSFRQRLRVAGESFKDIPNQPVGESLVGGGAGMLGAFGLSALLSKAGVNPYANSAISGAFGDTTGRVSAMVGNQIYRRLSSTGASAVGEAFTETAGQVALRAGTSLLRGGLEGAGIGLVTLPLDMLMNNALVNAGMSHAGSNVVSGVATGAVATGVIGGITLATAPETLGLSLVVGGIATGISALIGFFTGKAEDDKIKQARDEQNNKIGTRENLIESLPKHNYNFDEALSAMQKNDPNSYKDLQVDSDDFKTFKTAMEATFTSRPRAVPAPPAKKETGDAKRINDLFSQAVMHDLIDKVCQASGGDCSDLRKRQPKALTKDDTDFLNKQTNQTWETSVGLLVEQSFQEMNYTQVRIKNSQEFLLNQWNKNKVPAKNLDKYYSDTAFIDPKFKTAYMTNIKNDAQNLVVQAYYNNQTKLSQMNPNIIYASTLDPNFAGTMNTFYSAMETGANNLQISVAQLITLQSTAPADQPRLYENMQFDRVKGDTQVVDDARQLAEEQDKVRRADYYDIDSGFLDTADPTSISKWKPTDSQILQANQAGMSLNEYVSYIHQLSLGEAGDFKKIKTYTPEQELFDKQTDFSHFQDELQMAGYEPKMYTQDKDGNIVIDPNVSSIPNLDKANEYISQFEPAYVTQARHEYSNMVHNLNEKNQAEVDDYNADVRRQLSVFGNNYDEMVAGQNDYIARNALTATPLLVFNQADYLNTYLIDYNPISDTFPKGKPPDPTQPATTAGGQTTLPTTPTGTSGTTGTTGKKGKDEPPFLPISNSNNGSVIDAKLQAETEAGRRVGLTREQYLESKRIVQSEIGRGVATNEQIESVINRLKAQNIDVKLADVDTIYTSEGTIIKRTKEGKDITDTIDDADLADPIVYKPASAGINPQNTNAVASAQNTQQTKTKTTQQTTKKQPPTTSKGNK